MENSNKLDVLGELFHKKLENHRILADADSWDEIESRLAKPKNKAIIWLWSYGTVAAAATIAALLIINSLTPDEAPVMEVSLQVAQDETQKVMPAEITEIKQIEILKPADTPVNRPLAVFQPSDTDVERLTADTLEPIAQWESNEIENPEIAVAEQEKILIAEAEQQREIPRFDLLFMEEKTTTDRDRRWSLAAAFGSGSYSDNISNLPEKQAYNNGVPPKYLDSGIKGGGNDYAAELALSVPSFNHMSIDNFTNISHRPSLSFGITAHKNLGKYGGIESGLVYTYLASQFEWSEWGANYNANHSLYYVGVPVNMAVYLWNANPNWRIYFSGGFMAEKGIRAIYRQERRLGNETLSTNVKRSVDGLQWSLNSSLGLNYRFEKRWGVYFEPRLGYYFDCNQPISVRTEYPVYFGINLGLNYEL